MTVRVLLKDEDPSREWHLLLGAKIDCDANANLKGTMHVLTHVSTEKKKECSKVVASSDLAFASMNLKKGEYKLVLKPDNPSEMEGKELTLLLGC